MRACRSDLLAHGIDLDLNGREGVSDLVERHLDYFRAMLGYDAAPKELVALARRTRRSAPVH